MSNNKNMKKIIKLTALCCACGLFTGCEQTDGLEVMEESLKMSVVASIGDSNDLPSRRSASVVLGKETFVEDDGIGMMVADQDNFIKWNYNGSTWSPEGNAVYWPNRDTEYNFYAFYPYVNNASYESVQMPSLDSQNGTINNLTDLDFLIATAKQKYETNNGTVLFTGNNAFTHVSSLVCLTVEGSGDMASATLDKISMAGTDLVTSSTYSFKDKKVSYSDTKANILNIIFSNYTVPSTGETFYFLFNAETVNLSDVTLSIYYTKNGVKYKAEQTGINKSEGEQFKGGYQYTYSVNIVDETLKISGNSIKEWESASETLEEITLGGKKDESE